MNGWQYAEDSSDSNKAVTQDTSYLEFSLGLHSSGCLGSTVIQTLLTKTLVLFVLISNHSSLKYRQIIIHHVTKPSELSPLKPAGWARSAADGSSLQTPTPPGSLHTASTALHRVTSHKP